MIFKSCKLYNCLGYTFQDTQLLVDALTHRSSASNNNERLEFLGDALLNLVITEYLFQKYPMASEGELSRLRASLVKGETLAKLARGLGLGEWLRLGPGEIKNGGFQRESILADAMEAIFGAVYLDSGLVSCRDLILNIYRDSLVLLDNINEFKDPKTLLQEYLQGNKQALPVYKVIKIQGEPHIQNFTVECIAAEARVVAEGSSRRKAEQEAARRLLQHIRRQ